MSGGGDVKEEDLPIVGRGQDGWCREEFLELLECPGGILVPLKLVGLLEKFEEGQAPIIEPAYEPAQGCHAPN